MARRDPLNHSHFWTNSLLPGFSLLSADFQRHDYAPHSHEALVIAVTEAGGAELPAAA